MLLGLDIGTSSTKALAIDERGEAAAEASAPYAVERPGPGLAETDPERWWVAVTAAARALPPAVRAAVRAVGLSGQMHGAVLARADGSAVRPAILWLDGRTAELLARWPPDAGELTGNAPSAGMTGPTLAWLRDHEPASLAAARWVLLAKDWVRLRLTGEAASDPSDATGTLLADREGRWHPALVAAAGASAELLPPLVNSSGAAGRLLPSAAEALGLPAGVPVAAGAGDTLAAALGSGLLAEDAAQLAIGTSAQVVVPRAAWPGFSPRLNVYRSASPAGLPAWCLMAAMLNGGGALDWARRALQLSWDDAFARAFSEQGAGGAVVFLPYLTGERTPWMDPDLRAGWVGIGADDGTARLARAAFEGVAFGIRAGLDALREQGAAPARLRLAGGGTVHPGWRQLLSDALALPLDAVTVTNAAARGAALLGGLAAGLLAPADLAALSPSVTPAAEPREAGPLAERYGRFLDLRARLEGWFSSTRSP
ncbi:MAG TPA: FGGY family carbohydrate kinase [Anaeromyxobacter sp.]|nr:FGGY family carbohydrate kinase [Anaeromyxobacter sp.]